MHRISWGNRRQFCRSTNATMAYLIYTAGYPVFYKKNGKPIKFNKYYFILYDFFENILIQLENNS